MPAGHIAVPPPVMPVRKGTCLVPCVPLAVLDFLFKADRAQILKLCNLAQLCPPPQGFNETLGSTIPG